MRNEHRILLAIFISLNVFFISCALNKKHSAITQVFYEDNTEQLCSIESKVENLSNLDTVKKNRLDNLETHVKSQAEKISLLGTVSNENAAITKHRFDPAFYTFINDDWTIDNMPRTLKLTEQDRIFLQKYIRPAKSP